MLCMNIIVMLLSNSLLGEKHMDDLWSQKRKKEMDLRGGYNDMF